jgi:WD40 repeat protein
VKKPRVFLSYARKDGEEFATNLRKRLQKLEQEITLWQDRDEMEGGVGWWKQIEEALDQVSFLVIVMTPAAMQSEMTRKEWRYARQRGVNVYPVKGFPDAELDYAAMPNWMRKAHFFDLDREWETFVNYLKSDREPKRVAFMAPDLPEPFIPRPREFEQLIARLVDARRENPIAITSALQGAGGYGKTTLATALCHDDRVIDAFDDGILWVTLGQNPNVLAELTKLHKALTGDQPTFVDEEEAKLKLREKLENRNCLLVVDDVWKRAGLEPFLQGGKRTCARLITTRRLDVAMDAKPIHVDEMAPEEAIALLATRVPQEQRPSNLQPFRLLANRLMDWPLLLKLAAGVISARLDRNDTLEGALDYVNRAYEKRGLTAFDPKDAEQRNDAVAKSIQASLDLLDQDERTRLSELAIFPEDTDVPLPMIELLWGLDNLDTQEIATRLADFALLDFDLRAGIVGLHDEIRLYLGHALPDEESLHARLVDRLGNANGMQDPYALRWLPWHLGKAGRDAAQRALLVNFQWMLSKLERTDIQSLIADYDYLPKAADLRTVQSVLRHSAHILARNPRELPGQLLGRLPERLSQDIDSLRSQASEHKGFPWLRPLGPSLIPPDASLVRTLQGHTARITAVVITPDGRHAVSGSWDNTLRLWDLATGETKRTFQGHTHWVTAVAAAPDGRHLVSGSGDNTLRVCDLATGETKTTLQGHTEWVTAVALTPDSRHLVSGSGDNTLRVWDLVTGEVRRTFEGHTASVEAVAVSADGRHVVSGSLDHTLRVWNLASGETERTLKGHSELVTAVALTPDDRYVVSGSNDNSLRVWNLMTGKTIRTFQGHSLGVNAVAVTPDGHHVVSGSSDNTLRVWDLETGENKSVFHGHTGSVTALAVTPDGCRVVSGSWDRTLRVWNLTTQERKRIELQANTERVTAIATTPNDHHVISGLVDNALRVRDLATGEAIRTLQGHTEWVVALAVTFDGRRVVSGSWDHTLRVWNLASGETERVLQGHTKRVTAVAITFDGRHVVSGSADHTLRVWNLASGETERTLKGHTDSVTSVAVTPDGRRVVSGSGDHTLRVWNLASGETERTLKGHIAEVTAVAVTPDGHHVVSGSKDYTLRVWNWKDEKKLVTCTVDGVLGTCIVACGGQTIVARDGFGRVHFLQLEGLD